MGKSVNIVGKKYGRLLVTGKSDRRGADGSIMWDCLCECGGKKLVSTNALNTGSVKSCGCMQNKFVDLTNQKFGRLTVTSCAGYDNKGHSYKWNCICECGKSVVVLGSSLKAKRTVSCGCYSSEQKSIRSKTHGVGNENRLYRIWSGMKTRCYSQADHNYKRYGARGITMDENWRNDFVAFREWALQNGYKDDLSIDRIDNDGPYSPQNCRWSSKKDQNNNRRTNTYITYKGETRTVSEWAEITGIKKATLAQRKRNGWTDEECIEVPVKK